MEKLKLENKIINDIKDCEYFENNGEQCAYVMMPQDLKKISCEYLGDFGSCSYQHNKPNLILCTGLETPDIEKLVKSTINENKNIYGNTEHKTPKKINNGLKCYIRDNNLDLISAINNIKRINTYIKNNY